MNGRDGRGARAAGVLLAAIALGCGGGGQQARDAALWDAPATMDLGGPPSPVDAGADFARFRQPGPDDPRWMPMTATTVFATHPTAARMYWLRLAKDGSILVGGSTSGVGELRFHRAGAADVTLASRAFVAHLDRQTNATWVVGAEVFAPPALLADGAMVLAGQPSSSPVFEVWRVEADGSPGWRREFAASGMTFYSTVPTPEGDVVVVGAATPTVDLDPGPGTLFRTTSGSFIIKLSGATGDVAWIRTPPTQPDRIYPQIAALRSDGRLVMSGYRSTPNGEVALLYTLAADGMPDPDGWLKEFVGSLCGWTFLASGELLTCDVNENTVELASFLRVLDSATGRERSLQSASGIYDELVAGPTRVVGRLTDLGGDLFWVLDWWTPEGLLEGSLMQDFDPPEHRLHADGVDVDAAGRIVLGVSVTAPAGATLDLDPGPGVTSFASAGSHLAIIEVVP